MPDLFVYPGGNFGGKAQADFGYGVALHDAEVLPGVILQFREIVGQGQVFDGRSGLSDPGEGEVSQFHSGAAPGYEMPAAHIVHEVKGMDGSGGG